MDDSWLLECVQGISSNIVEWRRHLHANPELSFMEFETADFIAEKLQNIPGMSIDRGVGLPTTVVGTISRGNGPTIAIRADIDALPIFEETDHSFHSCNKGVMHACGHDAHTAMGLAVATLIGQIWDEQAIEGTVKFIFQPAEETADSTGKTGAQYLIDAGVLKDVDCVVALHVMPEHEVGTILIHDGYSSANVDVFETIIKGTGGHGAYPHLGTDPIWMLGPVLQALHGIVARNISPLEPAVISVGEIKAGSASNIIPSEVYMQGTLRSYSPEVREYLIEKLGKAFSLVETFGGEYSYKVMKGEPSLYNHPNVNAVFRETVKDLYPSMIVKSLPFGLGGEDFSHMTNQVSGAMFFLGCAFKDGVNRDLHTPIFDIDEECLSVGAAIMTKTILKFLSGESHLPIKE